MRNSRENGPLLSFEYLRVNFTVLIYTKNGETWKSEKVREGKFWRRREHCKYKTGG